MSTPFPKTVSDKCISCFPHVVNLACKAVLSAITKMEYAACDAQDYIPDDSASLFPVSFLDSIKRDPVATVWTLVRVVCILLLLPLSYY